MTNPHDGRPAGRFVALGVALLATLGAGTGRAAEPAESLTLAAAVERALERYPALGAARAERAGAAARAEEAEAALRPSLSLTAAALHFSDPMVVTPIHAFDLARLPDFDETLIQGALQVTYTLWDGGRRQARVRQERSRTGVAEALLQGSEQAIVARTVAAFLRVRGLHDTLLAHDRRLAAFESERGRVEQLLGVGRAAGVDLRRVEARVAAARADRVALAVGLDTAEGDLARLIDAPGPETRAARLAEVGLVAGPVASRGDLAERAAAASPRLGAAHEAEMAARAAVEVARSGRAPDLRLLGGYTDYGSSQGDFSGEWSAGLKLALPLYSGGAVRHRLAAAEAALAAASEERRLAALEVEAALDRALAAVAEAAARQESLERAVASFAEVARVERLRLEVGAGTQTDYLDAEAELLAARASRVEARLGAIAARTELARVTGDLGLDWVRATLESLP